jgi:hypothetical protein
MVAKLGGRVAKIEGWVAKLAARTLACYTAALWFRIYRQPSKIMNGRQAQRSGWPTHSSLLKNLQNIEVINIETYCMYCIFIEFQTVPLPENYEILVAGIFTQTKPVWVGD